MEWIIVILILIVITLIVRNYLTRQSNLDSAKILQGWSQTDVYKPSLKQFRNLTKRWHYSNVLLKPLNIAVHDVDVIYLRELTVSVQAAILLMDQLDMTDHQRQNIIIAWQEWLNQEIGTKIGNSNIAAYYLNELETPLSYAFELEEVRFYGKKINDKLS